MMVYRPKTAQNVEIYVGQKYHDNLRSAQRLISDAVISCLVTVGPRTEGCDCDVLYGQFFDGDKRAQELAQKINKCDGLCAKIVDVDPK
ncbi:hypothetical protein HY484_01900 [Candidatus Woesearchaeota archaeon]|nr:hypothetical protein [Candidatus Woesearchaeota archaeon]